MAYLKDLDQLAYALPFLSSQFKLMQTMFANACKLVDVRLQVDKCSQVVECRVPAGQDVPWK